MLKKGIYIYRKKEGEREGWERGKESKEGERERRLRETGEQEIKRVET